MKRYSKWIVPVFLIVLAGVIGRASSPLDGANRFYVHEDYSNAAQLYMEVARAGGEDAAEAAYLAAKAYARIGDSTRAVEAYQQVLTEHPKSRWAAEAGNSLGDLYVSVGAWEKALEAYQWVADEAVDATTVVVARINIGNTLQNPFNDVNEDYEVAFDNYDWALNNGGLIIVPHRPQIYFGMGECLRNLGRVEEAIPYYEKCVQIDRNGVWGAAAQNMIGNSRLYMNQYRQAEQAFQKAQIQYAEQPAFRQIADKNLREIRSQRQVRVSANVSNVIDEATPSSVVQLEDEVRVQGSGWELVSDRATWDPEERMLHCEGNVRLYREDGLVFSAETLSFRPPMDQIVDFQERSSNRTIRFQEALEPAAAAELR